MITAFSIGIVIGMGITNLLWIIVYNPEVKLALALIVLQTISLVFLLTTGRVRAWMAGEKGLKP